MYGMNSRAVTKPTGMAAAIAVRSAGRARTRSTNVGRSVADTATELDRPGESHGCAGGRDRARGHIGHEPTAANQRHVYPERAAGVDRIPDGAGDHVVSGRRSAAFGQVNCLGPNGEP